MKITLYTIGKLKASPWRSAAQEFKSRLKHYVNFKVIELKDVAPKNKTVAQIQAEESLKILNALSPKAYFVALDRLGKQYSSEEFAAFLQERRQSGPQELVFAIGGPDGFSQKLRERANLVLSFSKMTFPHEMAQVMLLEQLYRALTIIRGEKYHK